MWAGCADDEQSEETHFRSRGVLTTAFLQEMYRNPRPLYKELLDALHANVTRRGYTQKPQLSSTQRFDLDNRVFSTVDGFVPNHNLIYGVPPGARLTLGRRGRGRKLPQRRPAPRRPDLESKLAAKMGSGVLVESLG